MANDAATSLRNEYTIQLMKLPKKVRMHVTAGQTHCRPPPLMPLTAIMRALVSPMILEEYCV